MGLAAYIWNLQQWNAKVRAIWSVPPPALIKPARDLTPAEARELAAFLVYSNQVSVTQTFQFDQAGRITGPPPAQHLNINQPDIAGVTFLMPNGTPYHIMYNIQMAFLVVLWKLAAHMKISHGAAAIFAGGLGTGKDDTPNDCHHRGHCIDFYGIRKTDGTELKVLPDWGNKRFKRPDGKVRSCWPGDCGDKNNPDTDPFATQYFYRLDSGHVDGGGNATARDFFRAVYTFATGECRDNDAPAAPSGIGERSAIIHPDSPDNTWRVHHQNHIHFQLKDANS